LISYSAIIDGRLAFRSGDGHTIVVGFAREDEIKFRRKVCLPKQMGLIQKAQEMDSEKIGVHVEFVDEKSTGSMTKPMLPTTPKLLPMAQISGKCPICNGAKLQSGLQCGACHGRYEV
jgi:hypothetical protein